VDVGTRVEDSALWHAARNREKKRKVTGIRIIKSRDSSSRTGLGVIYKGESSIYQTDEKSKFRGGGLWGEG
jgi:hypothetical protein